MASPAGPVPAIQLLMLPLPVLGQLNLPASRQRMLCWTLGSAVTNPPIWHLALLLSWSGPVVASSRISPKE